MGVQTLIECTKLNTLHPYLKSCFTSLARAIATFCFTPSGKFFLVARVKKSFTIDVPKNCSHTLPTRMQKLSTVFHTSILHTEFLKICSFELSSRSAKFRVRTFVMFWLRRFVRSCMSSQDPIMDGCDLGCDSLKYSYVHMGNTFSYRSVI